MNRGYTPGDYRESVRLLRRAFPDAAVTTDVIVGFPGESEAEFLETLVFCRETAFSRIHVFPYSRREGTRASALPGQLDPAVKRERGGRLIALADELALMYHRRFLGGVVTVLVERVSNGGFDGVTGDYIKVRATVSADTDDTTTADTALADTTTTAAMTATTATASDAASSAPPGGPVACGALLNVYVTRASASGLDAVFPVPL
jgi:tRNA A37 methylthiotransferase MiaB